MLLIVATSCSKDIESVDKIENSQKINVAENSQLNKQANFIDKAISDINEGYRVGITEENLILNVDENFKKQTNRVLVFVLDNTKYTTAYSLESEELIALNSQYTVNKGLENEITYI